MLLLWALGCNGEGSSLVASQFIQTIINNPLYSDTLVICSSGSILEEKLRSRNLLPSSFPRIIVAPSFFRLYPIHFLVKLVFPISLIFPKVFVFDDYPFLMANKQLLYFQQLNLLTNATNRWLVKRFAFRILLTHRTIVYVQTCHVLELFLTCTKHPRERLVTLFHEI